MMKQTPVIVTDSTCDLPLQETEALQVEMLSLKVVFGSEVYEDKRTITNEEFYKKLESSKALPTTSLVSVGDFLDVFARHKQESIVVLTLSAKFSGTHQSAVVAKEMTGREDIYIVDTETISIALGMLVKQAVILRDEGADAQKIAAQIAEDSKRLRIYGIFDTLHYLVKGGRLSGVQGFVGSVLALKPILTIVHGNLSSIAKARGMAAAIRSLVEILQHTDIIDTEMPVSFAHSGNPAKMLELKKQLKIKQSDGEYTLGSVVGTHAGPGAIIVAFFIAL